MIPDRHLNDVRETWLTALTSLTEKTRFKIKMDYFMIDRPIFHSYKINPNHKIKIYQKFLE